MITYTPRSALEAAVLESERFELATDTAERDVLCVGHQGLPMVVLPRDAEGLAGLLEALGDGGRVFSVTAADPWHIQPEDGPEPAPVVVAAPEYLVMGLRPLKFDGRPLRVASGRGVVRLFLLPWTMPAKTLNFGLGPHFVVTNTRSVVGEWVDVPDGRRGVIVGLPEAWVGILERQCRPGATLAFRCDVPVPWVGEDGLANATPTTVGVYELGGAGHSDSDTDSVNGSVSTDSAETWSAKIPIAMTEGNVVSPVLVPNDLEVEEVRTGPWEAEWHGASDFSMSSLS